MTHNYSLKSWTLQAEIITWILGRISRGNYYCDCVDKNFCGFRTSGIVYNNDCVFYEQKINGGS